MTLGQANWRYYVLTIIQPLQIEDVNEDCYVYFQDGSFVIADIIVHCTGYAAYSNKFCLALIYDPNCLYTKFHIVCKIPE